jgi:hypothetical protein
MSCGHNLKAASSTLAVGFGINFSTNVWLLFELTTRPTTCLPHPPLARRDYQHKYSMNNRKQMFSSYHKDKYTIRISMWTNQCLMKDEGAER